MLGGRIRNSAVRFQLFSLGVAVSARYRPGRFRAAAQVEKNPMATNNLKNGHRKATSKPTTKPQLNNVLQSLTNGLPVSSQGQQISDMARAVGRFNENSEDPTHLVRAILSGMVTRGYRSSKGEVVKLEERPRVKAATA